MSHRPLHNAIVAFAVSAALGASIPIARRLALGDSDPFQSDWPIFLHATAFLGALVVAWHWRQWIAPAFGVSVGLAGYLLILGNSEYPVSSLIALAIHGFLPALAGSLVACAAHHSTATKRKITP